MNKTNEFQKTYPDKPEQCRALKLKLDMQIGQYPKKHQTARHPALVLNNVNRNNLTQGCYVRHPITDRTVFIDYVTQLLADKDKYTKQDNPVSSFKDILGAEGLKLYQLALDEEMHDIRYRYAVFDASSDFIEGATWVQPVSILVAGPSASGKSTAINRVLETIKDLPKKQDAQGQTIEESNWVTRIDGGISREVSQIYKLAIRISNELGYGGIEDLHGQSKILEKLRPIMRSTVLAEKDKFSIIIPETFSQWLNPFKNFPKLMKNLAEQRNFIFAQVVGDDPKEFKETVAYMGNRRAWKTDHDPVVIDLNDTTGIKESNCAHHHDAH